MKDHCLHSGKPLLNVCGAALFVGFTADGVVQRDERQQPHFKADHAVVHQLGVDGGEGSNEEAAMLQEEDICYGGEKGQAVIAWVATLYEPALLVEMRPI